ncbi:MAG: hypothetical protein AAFX06_14235 [Planctomycetota bacterium]
MTDNLAVEILDDLFHGIAFSVFLEEAVKTEGQPCSVATRVRAYRSYERELARRNVT